MDTKDPFYDYTQIELRYSNYDRTFDFKSQALPDLTSKYMYFEVSTKSLNFNNGNRQLCIDIFYRNEKSI